MIDHSGGCSLCHRNAADCAGGVFRLAGPTSCGICRNCWLRAGRSFGELPSDSVIMLADRRPSLVEKMEEAARRAVPHEGLCRPTENAD